MWAIAAQPPRKEPHIIISIRTPGAEPARVPRGPETRAVLFCEFPDLDERYRALPIGDKDLRDDALFGAAEARRILAFIKIHREAIQSIVVQCEGGISRSAGVAAALAKIFGEDDAPFFRNKTPNMLVYRTILQEHYGKT